MVRNQHFGNSAPGAATVCQRHGALSWKPSRTARGSSGSLPLILCHFLCTLFPTNPPVDTAGPRPSVFEGGALVEKGLNSVVCDRTKYRPAGTVVLARKISKGGQIHVANHVHKQWLQKVCTNEVAWPFAAPMFWEILPQPPVTMTVKKCCELG